MTNPKLPELMQFSFVVEDLESAIQHWAQNFHVGPFFVSEHIPYKSCLYLGQPIDLDMSVAIAYNGSIQIELVKQHNDSPSIFREFMLNRGDGLQHVAMISEDLSADLARYAANGVTPVQEGEAENGTRFAYLNTDRIPGTMLELVSPTEEVLRAFNFMRNAADSWMAGDSAKYGG
ncbi:MAG: VOC family protein [Pseudomonadota bacterium]